MSRKYRVKRPNIQQPYEPWIRHIALTKGQVAVVDAADYDALMEHNWCAQWDASSKSSYAQRHIDVDGRRVWLGMHTAILKPARRYYAAFRDGNTLNLRRGNLYAKRYENSVIPNDIKKHPLTKHYGFSWDRHHACFTARIKVQGKSINLIHTNCPYEASEAYAVAVSLREDAANQPAAAEVRKAVLAALSASAFR